MTFRTRLLLILMASVAITTLVVEWLVLSSARRAFETLEAQRADALAAQFRREFERRGEEIFRDVTAIAASEDALNIALAPDYSVYHGEAGRLAAARGLDLLEIVAGDGAIIDSAQWPARFGYREEWLAGGAWHAGRAFLRREELPDGFSLAVTAVAEVNVADRKLYIAGGQRLDANFLSTLSLPAGMRALLYRNLEAGYGAANFTASGGAPAAALAAQLGPLMDRVRARKKRPPPPLAPGPEPNPTTPSRSMGQTASCWARWWWVARAKSWRSWNPSCGPPRSPWAWAVRWRPSRWPGGPRRASPGPCAGWPNLPEAWPRATGAPPWKARRLTKLANSPSPSTA